jgi:hypothetical protein
MFLWTFKESSNNDGPPDLRGRFPRKSMKLKDKINGLPHPLNPRKNPRGLQRRD